MVEIIVAFPKRNDVLAIKNILTKHGYHVIGTATSAAAAMKWANEVDYGIMICAYQFVDMQYLEMKSYLHENIRLLLICALTKVGEMPLEDISYLPLPLKVGALIGEIDAISNVLYQKKREYKRYATRSTLQKIQIEKAKTFLMEKRGMCEEEAHTYIQRRSMENGETLYATARKVISLYEIC